MLLQDFMLRGSTDQAWEPLVLAIIGVLLFVLTSITLPRSLHSAA